MLECQDNGAINVYYGTVPAQEPQPSMFIYEPPESDVSGWLQRPRFTIPPPSLS